ncbi:MAG: alpha/beta fold hydrolase [Planctomycetes bacterium]|nr:alpha/beta fold hydrolase [Planctomycetota bacterium]
MIGPLHNRHGERLDHVVTPGRAGAREIVVVAHGVTSQHDRPYLVALCEALAAAGVASLRFSFAGNGRSEGAFAEATIGKEVADLGCVLDACGDRRIGCVGHSMGAAVGVLRAAADPRIAALVSLAGMVHVRAFCERHFAGLVPGRDQMFDRPGCGLSQAFLDDARAVDTVLPAAQRITVPWLLVHGDRDELVPRADAEAARRAAGGRPELRVLAGADHRFTGCIEPMVAAVVPWLLAALRAPA